ncbi:MAG: copper resistance protein CopC, partial [Gemmatimonadaceae bacterium]|nr:copper resistance protein CopC [Gemmatimonadaceae bacterium]
MRPMFGVLAIVVMVSALVAARTPQRVFAHASYVSSDPAADSVVLAAPATVAIRFSEAMAPTGSSAQVLDAQGRRVDLDDSRVDASDTTRMTVSLAPLGEGTYTVAWRNVSTVDGHGLQGSFVFFVGSRPADAPTSQALEPPLLQSRADPVVRWITLLGALTALGAVAFDPLILRRATRGEHRAAVETALRAARVRIQGVAFLGTAAFLAGSGAQLLLQAGITADVVAYRVTPADVSDVLSSDWGVRWLVRALCLAGALVLLGAQVRAARRSDGPLPGFRGWAPISGLLVTAMVMVSLSSHGAAVDGLEAPGAINDGLHLGASAVWVGGLVALLVTVHALITYVDDRRRGLLVALASRFSLFAGLSVGALVATGLYSSWLQVTSRDAFDTPYGSVLAAKVVLVLGLLVFGALNLLWVRPRLMQAGADVWLHRFVAAEVGLALIVIVAVAGLTSLEPARQVHSREQQRGALTFEELVQGTRIEGEIGPGTVGTNRIAVRLADRSGDAVVDATNVLVRLKYLDRDLSPIEVNAISVGGGR